MFVSLKQINMKVLVGLTVLLLSDLGSCSVLNVSNQRSLARCCSGGNIISCNKAEINLNELGSGVLNLPSGEILNFQGFVNNNPHAFYYVSGESNAVLTQNPKTKGVHGHAMTVNGSYVLEHCGDEGHVWKTLGPYIEGPDGVAPPPGLKSRRKHEHLVNAAKNDRNTEVSFSVKFYYTPEFAASTADIDGFLDQVIAETNQGYANSEIPLRIYKLCHEQATINDVSSPSEMLTNFANMKSREELLDGADVAAILVDDFAACGIGYLNVISAGYTFSATAKSCAVGYYSFGHEVGHNIGAHHDPDTSTNSYYSYGHGHLIAAGTASDGARTIMAYYASGHSLRVNYWSNPNVNYPATGTATGVADLSDNARLLTENRASLAAIGSESSSTCSGTTTASPTKTSTTPVPTTTTPVPTTTTTQSTSCVYQDKAPKPKRIAQVKKIKSPETCEEKCKDKEGCMYWSWKPNKVCQMFSIQFNAKKRFVSGLINCKPQTTTCTTPNPPTTVATTTSGPSTGSCKCGLAKRSTRIVGGQVTEVNEYPWQVGLVSTGSDFIWCGGTLISDQWVLTAAHCTVGESASSLQVLLGEHDKTTTSESNTVRASLSAIVDHPDYDDATTNYDFSLLKLDTPIDFEANEHIRPICLPSDDSSDFAGLDAIVTGWGATSSGGSVSDQLQEVTVQVLSNTACKNTDYPSSMITDQMLCAGVNGGGKDSCQGDSGGPLVTSGSGDGVTPGQNYQHIGVVSWGYGCAWDGYPGVYARTSKQLAWIQSTTSTSFNTCPRT